MRISDWSSDVCSSDLVALTIHVARLDKAAVVALARLIALAREGRWHRSHFPAERRARRWSQVLRVHDALLSGASQRDIADVLFGTAGIAHWRVHAAPWRRRAQRLVDAARRAAPRSEARRVGKEFVRTFSFGWS